MKLAVITDEVSQDLTATCALARGLGFTGLEVRSFDGAAPDLHSQHDLQRARETITTRGLAVAGYCPAALKRAAPDIDEEVDDARQHLIHAADQARWLGAPHIRVFSFYRAGEPDPAGAARRFLTVAGDVDLPVPMLLETGTRTNTPTVRHALHFLDLVGDRVAGILWDPGNSVFAEFVPPAGVFDEWRLGADRIAHVHVKDPVAGARYVRLGDGDLPWPALLGTMAAAGYSGWLSLETHWRDGPELTPALRDNPHGEPFSAGGFSASAECMRILADWVSTSP